LTVQNLSITQEDGCHLNLYPENLNFEMNIRELMTVEQKENQVFQIPKIQTTNLTKTLRFQMQEAADTNEQFWQTEIDKLDTQYKSLHKIFQSPIIPLACSNCYYICYNFNYYDRHIVH